MLYNYTVTLQSKIKGAPRRFATKAEDIKEVIRKLKQTHLAENYNIKSIIRGAQI